MSRPPVQAAQSDPAQRRILIVEDDQTTARALQTLLAAEGFSTAVFHNAKDAIAHSVVFHIDAALVDVHLPDLNGLVLTQQLRERIGGAVPILVVSGDTSMETLNSLQHVGATHFFAKPTTPAKITARLRELLG